MTRAQRLRSVPSRFAVDHLPTATFPEDDEWIALVRAPEGLTVVREVPPWDDGEHWIGFYGAASSHTVDRRGALAAMVAALASAGVEVFVASTYHADLVLVPEARRADAATALRSAGFELPE